ncbi:hypothetical protein PIB30_020117 [Stylosanthes scabra]|uniref:COP1-interacting protein 7 n=1 Tax=Stylosanthes scabra TaxID=79078 RepID=A0ABU6XA07_9FABA|nr:hypothetical protein [Stylosanthes scabra]
MEDALHADVPLDYASIRIFPNQNRYEAFVCKGKQSEQVMAGDLEHLLPHIPAINKLYAKGSNANFDLELPENMHGAEWFSKATVTRFLHIISSPDLIIDINTIMDEMSQLEESKKFHVSLYGKPEEKSLSSDASKNELLRAMDLRLTALRSKLVETIDKAVGATCSPKTMTHLAKFSQHFGAIKIEHSLCKFIELNQTSQDIGPLNNRTPSTTCDVTSNAASNTVKVRQISRSSNSDAPVVYGVSPAKAAQIERHSSTGSEESSNSSDEDKKSAERSRSLVRSATPRRSASPMRRVQIGRAGPRRAAAITIKSLNFFPGKGAPISYRDAAENGSDGEVSEQPFKKSEIDVRRITVQDAISLFEGKQRDQTTDVQKRKSLADVSTSTNKSVLRRWSAGMGETSVQDQPEVAPEDPLPVTSSDVVDVDNPKNFEVEVVSDFTSESHDNDEISACYIKQERQQNSSFAVDDAEETEPKEETSTKLAASAEWNKRKQEEFNQILKKMVESKPVMFGKSQPSRNQNIPFEQRGGSYDHYKEKRDAKLRGENTGKRVEKEAQFREMQQLLDKRKEMLSKNLSASKKSATRLPQKSLRNPTQPANSPKETSKPIATKKTSKTSKTSPMPAVRKSWSATPSPRASGSSPVTSRGGITSASTTPTCRKPTSGSSVPQPSPQKEKSQVRNRNEKEPQAGTARSVKSNEKRQPAVANKSKATKAKVTTASEETTTVPSKTNLASKGTKKSSVVPLESKPFLRKGSRMGNGTGSGAGNLNKKKTLPKLDKSLNENGVEHQETELVVNASDPNSQHSDRDTATPTHQNAATEPESQVNNHLQCGEIGNLDQDPTEVGDVSTDVVESPIEIRNEEESTISPSAWVEEETEEDLERSRPVEDNTFQPASLASIPTAGSASPRVRHSLSQMLQEEISEPDTCEWGNAENPPVIISQKDAPKGFKRLLKFARKSKGGGDTGSSGWSSPSVFSEGEDDAEDFKASNKRNADNLLRKAALNMKSYGQPKSSVHEGYERNIASRDDGKGSHKMHDGVSSTRGQS